MICYIFCAFGELWLNNSGVYEGKRCTPRRFFFKINLSDKLFQELLDQFSPTFHHVVVI